MNSDVVFGGKTALQIHAALQRRGSNAVSGIRRLRRAALPLRVPNRKEIEVAVAHLRGRCPDLSLDVPLYVVVGNASRAKGSPLHAVHVCTEDLPSGSLVQAGPNVRYVVPELALVQMTAGLDKTEVLSLLWEACGTYRTARCAAGSEYHVDPLANVDSLGRYLDRIPSLHKAGKVRDALRYVADGSASAQETKCALLLGLPKMYGGYGLGMPVMNHEVFASAAARASSGRKRFRLDLCWPDALLDVEYQSFEHHGNELSRLRDSRRSNELVSMGWMVVGITDDEIRSIAAMNTIADAIRRRLGKEVGRLPEDYHARMLRLRRQLGISLGYD